MSGTLDQGYNAPKLNNLWNNPKYTYDEKCSDYTDYTVMYNKTTAKSTVYYTNPVTVTINFAQNLGEENIADIIINNKKTSFPVESIGIADRKSLIVRLCGDSIHSIRDSSESGITRLNNSLVKEKGTKTYYVVALKNYNRNIEYVRVNTKPQLDVFIETLKIRPPNAKIELNITSNIVIFNSDFSVFSNDGLANKPVDKIVIDEIKTTIEEYYNRDRKAQWSRNVSKNASDSSLLVVPAYDYYVIKKNTIIIINHTQIITQVG
jgi:hypothetical protein